MGIYSIQRDYLLLMKEIEDNDGILENPELLERIEKDFQNSSINYCYVIQEIENEINFIDAEKVRLDKLKVRKQNNIKHFQRIFEPMFKMFGSYKKTPTGIEKWKIDLNTFMVEVEQKDKIEIKGDVEIDEGFTKYTIEATQIEYNKLPADIKTILGIKTKKTNKTDIINEIKRLNSQINAIVNELDNDASPEENEELMSLIRQRNKYESYLITEKVQTIKIK